MENFDDIVDKIVYDGKKKPVTYVAMILDSSGSMQSIANEIVGGFNTQIDALKEKEEEQIIKLSVITFSDYVLPLFWHKAPSDAAKLTDGAYKPHGMTALCDAVGMVINSFKETAETDKEASFLLLIMSDGAENSSQKYKPIDIKKMVTDLMKTNMWTFTYLGANQDMWDVAAQYGLNVGSVNSFMATSKGVSDAYAINNTAVMSYLADRSRGITSKADFYTTTTKQEENVWTANTYTVPPADNSNKV